MVSKLVCHLRILDSALWSDTKPLSTPNTLEFWSYSPALTNRAANATLYLNISFTSCLNRDLEVPWGHFFPHNLLKGRIGVFFFPSLHPVPQGWEVGKAYFWLPIAHCKIFVFLPPETTPFCPYLGPVISLTCSYFCPFKEYMSPDSVFLSTPLLLSFCELSSHRWPSTPAQPPIFLVAAVPLVISICFLSEIFNYYLLHSNQLTCFVATPILPYK